jgi:HAD superfamily hydrolase (TIGR01484 family)
MSFTLLSQVGGNGLKSVRLVATDMDGTVTRAGKFTSMLLQALENLAQAGIPVLIVTGRSAGWVSGLVQYLPIWGAIAENGGLFYPAPSDPAKMLVPIADVAQHRRNLANVFHQLQAEFPTIQETVDNPFRLTDWTFDIQNLTGEELHRMGDRCQSWGWGFTYSTVQCHIKFPQQSKAAALQQVLDQYFSDLTPEQIVTVGDSPNDETLFDTTLFPRSVGVANLLDYRDRLTHKPAYITSASEGEGFCELIHMLLESIS